MAGSAATGAAAVTGAAAASAATRTTVTPDGFTKPLTPAASRTPKRWIAYTWAETQAGAPYYWGGTSYHPGYDCSGLVMKAYQHVGIWLPHSTVQMVNSGRMYRITWAQARGGDLAFWGAIGSPYHVELLGGAHNDTFGAHTYGVPAGWDWPWTWPRWDWPSAVYRVNGAG